MTAYLKDTLRKILIAAAHLWVTNAVCDPDLVEDGRRPKGELPEWATYYVYSRDLVWGNDLLKNKRIVFRMYIEDYKP